MDCLGAAGLGGCGSDMLDSSCKQNTRYLPHGNGNAKRGHARVQVAERSEQQSWLSYPRIREEEQE
jgi:hypothetical protein